MFMSTRTYTVGDKGSDVKSWQQEVKAIFKKLGIACPIVADGIYGVHSRSYTAALCHAQGLSATTAMKNGVTPELRIKLRNAPGSLTAAQKKTRASAKRKKYRADLKKRWAPKKVHQPVSNILADSWDYHPPVHDGIDVICKPNAALFAMVKSKVIDVRADDWWGNNPSGDKSKGDGIIQLEVLESVGPFKKGQHIGYGHAEHARVRVGEIVQAGEVIGLAGLAVAWHVHLMINAGNVGNRGVGNVNPRAALEYTKKHG
jgi:murein DD-endopeptidase MepM/ murein hydrolase activator NlpD